MPTPPEIKYESKPKGQDMPFSCSLICWGGGEGVSKFSVYCVYDCSLQVSSDKPNLQFYARNVVCFTRTCDLSHIYIM